MKRWCVLCIVLSFLFSAASPVQAQVRQSQMPWFSASMNTSKLIDGYYQSLPANYNDGDASYPLIVYLHGDESVEDGRMAILKNSIPKLITDGSFPEAFNVQGKEERFIIIAPHYTYKAVSADALDEAAQELDKAIDYIITQYRVNAGRIYLTGMSRGGGYTWVYAGAATANAAKLAAIVPIAGAANPNTTRAAVIGNADLPVWATHNDDDYLVPASKTTDMVNLVNEQKPTPRANVTLFNSTAHEGWTATYNPDSKEYGGKNIYEWMLQHVRSAEAPLPVTLTSFKASASAIGVMVSWSTATEATGSFTLERSGAAGNFVKLITLPANNEQNRYTYIDQAPLAGVNHYRLLQTEPDGSITYFQIVTINQARSSQPAFALHPNPVTAQAVLQLTTAVAGAIRFAVYTASGLLMQQWTAEKPAGFWQQSISFAALPAGSYVVVVQAPAFRHSLTFIKR